MALLVVCHPGSRLGKALSPLRAERSDAGDGRDHAASGTTGESP